MEGSRNLDFEQRVSDNGTQMCSCTTELLHAVEEFGVGAIDAVVSSIESSVIVFASTERRSQQKLKPPPWLICAPVVGSFCPRVRVAGSGRGFRTSEGAALSVAFRMGEGDTLNCNNMQRLPRSRGRVMSREMS